MSRSQIVLLVAILNTIIEVILQVLLIVKIMNVFSIELIRLLLLLSFSGLANSGNLTEFGIVDHSVSIVVAAPQKRFDIFFDREEIVLLKESDQVWHTNGVVSFRKSVKDSHLHEILARSQLILRLSARPLQLHLFVQ